MVKTLKSIGVSILIAIVLLYLRKIGNISVSPVDATSLGNFIMVIGVLYGIMAAFVVYAVYDRYNKIIEVSEKETDNLSYLYALVTYLEDDKISGRIKMTIKEYAKIVIEKGWVKLYKGEKSKSASTALFKLYGEIKFLSPVPIKKPTKAIFWRSISQTARSSGKRNSS